MGWIEIISVYMGLLLIYEHAPTWYDMGFKHDPFESFRVYYGKAPCFFRQIIDLKCVIFRSFSLNLREGSSGYIFRANWTWVESNDCSIWCRGHGHLPPLCSNKNHPNHPILRNYCIETATCVKWVPSGYLTVCHGKSPFLIGKPSISMGHGFHGYVSHKQRVPLG